MWVTNNQPCVSRASSRKTGAHCPLGDIHLLQSSHRTNKTRAFFLISRPHPVITFSINSTTFLFRHHPKPNTYLVAPRCLGCTRSCRLLWRCPVCVWFDSCVCDAPCLLHVCYVSVMDDTADEFVIWLIQSDKINLFVMCYSSFICTMSRLWVRRLIYLSMTLSCAWHDSFMRDMTHSCVCSDSFVRVTQLIQFWYYLTHSYVWHSSFVYVTRLICLSYDSFVSVTLLAHMCDSSHLYVSHSTLISRMAHLKCKIISWLPQTRTLRYRVWLISFIRVTQHIDFSYGSFEM